MTHLRSFVWGLFLVLAAASCGSSGTSPSTVPTATGVASAQESTSAPTIVLSEWKVTVPSTLKAGTVTFTITNSGTIQHELLVFKSGLAPAAYPTDKAGNIVEDAPGITLLSDGENIDPGASQTRTVNLSKPGKYLFVCNIPGHFRSGMFSVVTVTP